MLFGEELREQIERGKEATKEAQRRRAAAMDNCEYDLDDCFVSVRLDQTGLEVADLKLEILADGGLAWFTEFATLDGELCKSRSINTRYGAKDLVETPAGEEIWVGSWSRKALAKKGLKLVRVRRAAWVALRGHGRGLYGAAMATPATFPSDVNYWTGEPASEIPAAVVDYEEA